MKVSSVLFVLSCCSLMICCSKDNGLEPKEPVIRPMTQGEQRIVDSSEKFAFKFFQQLQGLEADKNIFVSPLSVAMALGMTYNGAAGETESAMRTTLEFGEWSNEEINASFKSLIDFLSQLDPKVQMSIANSIWYRQGFDVQQSFLTVNSSYFYALVRALNFAAPDAADIINAWVKEKTRNRIDQIVDTIDASTVMFLINAIYFKGTWTYEFKKTDTRDDKFYVNATTPVDIRMMRQTNDFRYFENSDLQAVQLPYGDDHYRMVVFLPRPEKSVDELIAGLTDGGWATWTNGLEKAKGLLELPAFELEYESTLNNVLTAMGMGIAFSPGQADFSKINPSEELFISQVRHKSFVKVDEEGTEAAAVTIVEIRTTSAGGDELDFVMRVDRPFVFAIYEEHSDALLFMGKILNPNK